MMYLNSSRLNIDGDLNVNGEIKKNGSNLDQLGSLYLDSSSQHNGSTLHVKHDQDDNKCITIENKYGRTINLNAGEKAGSSKNGGLMIMNDNGRKHWIILTNSSDKKTEGVSNNFSVDYNYSFTGHHLCVMKKLELQEIKKGMIVSSMDDICNFETGRDFTSKESIRVSNAVPMVELCKKEKNKRVYGVFAGILEVDEEGWTYANTESGQMTFQENLGDDEVRVAINSIGEGAILVVNSGGNIEGGDYLCSSLINGYCQKQNDDLLHNYTVAKSVIDCKFELNHDLYDCYELYNGMRCALIACIYQI